MGEWFCSFPVNVESSSTLPCLLSKTIFARTQPFDDLQITSIASMSRCVLVMKILGSRIDMAAAILETTPLLLEGYEKTHPRYRTIEICLSIQEQ